MLRRSILWLAVCLLVCHAQLSHAARAGGDVLVARQSNPQLPTFTVFSGVGTDIGSTASETRANYPTRSTSITSTTVTRTDAPPPSSTTVDASSSASSLASSSASATSMASSSASSSAASATSSRRPDSAAAAHLPVWPALLLGISLAAYNVV